MHWYCDFYTGKRGEDDERQIKRWMNTAGPRSRFRKALINMIKKKGTTYDDYDISPKIRQTLQHWGYKFWASRGREEFRAISYLIKKEHTQPISDRCLVLAFKLLPLVAANID